MLNLSELDRAWLAGFIDGEGYIGITFQRKRETNYQSASARYHPYLIITNTDERIIKHIQGLLGTGRTYRLPRAGDNAQKSAFQYKLTGLPDLKAMLSIIGPFLRLKKAQSDVVRAFIDLRESAKIITGRGSRGATSYTNEDLLYQQLRTLNHRGR